MMEKAFETSLKSIETENVIDLYFYRPVGYHIARVLQHTIITPNAVTIVSIFVGSGVGYLFYFNKWWYSLAGVLLLIAANILDCVDGQLARLTGKTSKLGRILDGMAGDIWFTLIYVAFALQLKHAYGSGWFFVPAVISGLSHLVQANITDYYKTLHLYFISSAKGRDFQNARQPGWQHKTVANPLCKALFLLYQAYTFLQERLTPDLQRLMGNLNAKYGDDLPDVLRTAFRSQSRQLMMRYVDWLTFNGRTVVLFIVVMCGYPWLYFIYETLALNVVMCVAIYKHEAMCRKLNEQWGV